MLSRNLLDMTHWQSAPFSVRVGALFLLGKKEDANGRQLISGIAFCLFPEVSLALLLFPNTCSNPSLPLLRQLAYRAIGSARDLLVS